MSEHNRTSSEGRGRFDLLRRADRLRGVAEEWRQLVLRWGDPPAVVPGTAIERMMIRQRWEHAATAIESALELADDLERQAGR